MLHTNNTPRGNAGIWPAAVCITDCWFCCMTDCACTLPEVCDAGRICTMFAAAAAADSLELGPVELLELLPLGGPRDTGWPGGPPELLLLLLCGSWDWFIWSPSEPPVPFSSTIAAFSIASCLSCHSPRPELPASFEILPAVSKRLEVEGGRGGGWWWRMRKVPRNWSHSRRKGGDGVRYHYTAIGLVSLTYTAPSHTTIYPKKKLLLLAISTHVNNFHHHTAALRLVSLWRTTPNASLAHIHSTRQNGTGRRRHTNSPTPACIGVVAEGST